MPAFSYEALNLQGQLCKGVLEADSVRVARSVLRTQTLIPLRVEPVRSALAATTGTGLARPVLQARAFRAGSLAVWTRQLSGLVAAGLPLERALGALMDESEDARQKAVVAALRADVNAGSALAPALARHPREFPPVYVSVVSAGEASGRLGAVLQRMADDLDEAQQLRGRLLGAALYPAIVTLISLAIVGFLVSYVVPQVASVFMGGQRQLPWITTALLSLSDFVRSWGWLLLLALAAGAVALRLALSRPVLRQRFDAAWLKLPLVGKLARNYNAARFGATLAMLVGAGVPILKALQAAADTLSNRAMQLDAVDALERVREGAPLGMALAQKKRFPGLLSMFARLGEQTGELPQMLQRAATQLSAEVQRRAMNLATLLEPLLIVVMGGAVMLIVLAILLPIIELNQMVR